MSFNSQNYYSLREEFEKKHLAATERAEARKHALECKIDGLREINEALSLTASRIFGAALEGKDGLDKRIEIIKKDTGISPKGWITYFLAARAKVLLDSREDHTVQQISNLLGFGEQASFARFFKRETGMTPKEYRSRRSCPKK